MTRHNMRFLSSVFVICVFSITSADAAPSVKMLGTNSARIGTNAAVVKSNNNNTNASTQRLGSIRPKTANSGAPVAINKVASPSVATSSDSDARLSLGKYIHSTGVSAGTIKPVATGVSGAEISSSDFLALTDRVRSLENGKQDAFVLGDGLVLDGNTISIDPAVLQNQVEENVNTALEDNYYTADEIDTILEESGVTPPTYVSTTQDNVEYQSINVADTFDDGFNFAN